MGVTRPGKLASLFLKIFSKDFLVGAGSFLGLVVMKVDFRPRAFFLLNP